MLLKIKLRRYFVTGTIVLLPIFITINILSIIIRFIDNLLGRYINRYLENFFGISFFGLGLIALIVLIFVVGMLATNVFMKKVMPFIEQWFLRIPFVQQIYPSIKQLVRFLFAEEKFAFKKVVYFEYPKTNMYTIGFITNEFMLTKLNGEKVDSVCVYIASVPNPITGFFVIVPKKDVIFLDISIDEALKIIISGGVLMRNNLFENCQKVRGDISVKTNAHEV